jgi:predicted transcriptional regulator
MKKEISMTVRLEAPLGELLQKLAKEDDRSIGYVLRQLIVEALQARKRLPATRAKKLPDR